MKINEANITPQGVFNFTITRADGKVEKFSSPNLFTVQGGTYLAALQSTAPDSVMNHMLVGTISTAASVGDVVGSMGEVARVTMATRTNVLNVLTEVATFAGNTNGITSVVLREVGVVNLPSSGPNGKLRSRSVFSAVTLGASDFLSISYATTCGSF
jgi:Na+-transporting NADH:ubiquinone oxidoreductase subunit NqrB